MSVYGVSMEEVKVLLSKLTQNPKYPKPKYLITLYLKTSKHISKKKDIGMIDDELQKKKTTNHRSS